MLLKEQERHRKTEKELADEKGHQLDILRQVEDLKDRIDEQYDRMDSIETRHWDFINKLKSESANKAALRKRLRHFRATNTILMKKLQIYENHVSILEQADLTKEKTEEQKCIEVSQVQLPSESTQSSDAAEVIRTEASKVGTKRSIVSADESNKIRKIAE